MRGEGWGDALFISCKIIFFLILLLYFDNLNKNKTFSGLRIHPHLLTKRVTVHKLKCDWLKLSERWYC